MTLTLQTACISRVRSLASPEHRLGCVVVEWRWSGGTLSRRDRGDSHMCDVWCGSGGAV